MRRAPPALARVRRHPHSTARCVVQLNFSVHSPCESHTVVLVPCFSCGKWAATTSRIVSGTYYLSRSRATIMRMTSFVPKVFAAYTPSKAAQSICSCLVYRSRSPVSDLRGFGARVCRGSTAARACPSGSHSRRAAAAPGCRSDRRTAQHENIGRYEQQPQPHALQGVFAARTLKPLSVAKSLAIAA